MNVPEDREINLRQLQDELAAVGIVVTALGRTGDELHTYDEDGAPADLPPEAAAVVEAHEPQAPPSDDDFYRDYLEMVQEVTADVGVLILVEVVKGKLFT